MHRDRQRGRIFRNRNQAVTPRERAGQRGRHNVEIEIERVNLDEPEPGVARQGVRNLYIGEEAEIDNGFLDRRGFGFCGPADRLYLVRCEKLAEDEHLQHVGAVRRTIRPLRRTFSLGWRRRCRHRLILSCRRVQFFDLPV